MGARGLNVTSENPVYVVGPFNATNAAFANPHAAAAIIADAVTLLSPNWRDQNSFANPNNPGNRARTNGDLVPDTSTPPAPAAATVSAPSSASLAAAAPSGNASPEGASAAAPAAEVAKEEAPDERQWRGRAAAIKSRVQKAPADVQALTGGPAHPDPREQAKVDALAVRAKDALGRAEAAQVEFEKEAAAAKVPRPWIQ